VTLDIIDANRDIAWNYNWISLNPNITWEIIEARLDKDWDWDFISGNNMRKYKESWIHEKCLQHIKALQIQRHWRNCTCNPEFKLAQKLLLQLYVS